MAEFALPRNSKVQPGKTHKAPAGAKRVKAFKLYRWSPDDDRNPHLDPLEVDLADCGPLVLDALIKIKNAVDTPVTFPPTSPQGTCGTFVTNRSTERR